MGLIHWLATATPTPAPLEDDAVGPGWIGFVFVFAIAVITVFLILDMTRRVRRVRYRSEVQDKLAAEKAENAEKEDTQPPR